MRWWLALALFVPQAAWAQPAPGGPADTIEPTEPAEPAEPAEPSEPSVEPVQEPTPSTPASQTSADAPAAETNPGHAPGESSNELEQKVDAIAGDLSDLRESLYVPEEDVKKSVFGMGPAASKVYGRPSGLSLGGYGEMYYAHDLETAATSTADLYRYIQYVGYKFSDAVVMNTELEFEHATTGSNPANDETGEVSVEFAYLDFLLHERVNLRTGLMLLPVGITNEMHEPTTYFGNLRPEVERRIIPSTWRELGFGVFGALPYGLSYKAYLVNGAVADGFGSSGIRGGRQSGNHAVVEDVAMVLRADWQAENVINVGASLYYGGADQDPTRMRSETNGIVEGHFIARHGGAELRGLVAYSFIDVDEPDPGNPDDARGGVPESQYGYYLMAAYDLWPHLSARPNMRLSPFLRFEKMNLRASPEPTGGLLDTYELLAGLDFKPVPDVVLKAEFSTKDDATDMSGSQQTVRLGAGFIY